MPLKSLKNKITAMAEGEVLGDAAASPENLDNKLSNVEFSYEIPKKTKIKKPQSNKPLKQRAAKDILLEEKFEVQPGKIRQSKKTQDNDKIKDNNKTKKAISGQIRNEDLIDGYKDVLAMLGVPLTIDINTEFNSEDLDYVEFTQTQPIGFDFDEVTDFISRVKYNLYKLESALRQRDLEVRRLASEIKRVEEKMIEASQAKELERMIGGMTQEEILIEKNMDLNVQVNELTRKLANLEKDSSANNDLIKEIEVLRSENDILKMNNKISGLPSMDKNIEEDEDIEDIDMFVNMLDDIGGLYDE